MTPEQIKQAIQALWTVVRVLALVGAGFAFAWKWQEVRYLEREAEIVQGYLDGAEEQAIHYEKQRLDTETNRATLYATWRKDHEELATLRRDIAAGKYRVFIRATCPGQRVSEAAADSSGTPAGTCELDTDTRSDILDLRESIQHNERLLNFCRAEYFSCKNHKK